MGRPVVTVFISPLKQQTHITTIRHRNLSLAEIFISSQLLLITVTEIEKMCYLIIQLNLDEFCTFVQLRINTRWAE